VLKNLAGDTEFDSFFDEPAAGDAPVEAAEAPADASEDMFAAPQDDACDAPADAPEDMFAAPQDCSMGGFDAPCDAPAPDMSSAFTTTQNLASDSPALQTWRAENEKKLGERAKKSNEDMAALLEQAKKDRDTFYEQRKIETDAAGKANKDEEDLSKESKAALASKDNLWESVSDMIDLQAKGDGKDVARMRSVMISMKNA
jgi:hypothetical protein